MTVRAKFKVSSIEPHDGPDPIRVVRMDAVYSDDPASPNHSWSKWTPAGQVQMTITNPAAFEQFVQGKEYYLDFTPAE
jgi:hypothetical protein